MDSCHSGISIAFHDLLGYLAGNHADENLLDGIELDGVDQRIGADIKKCEEKCPVIAIDETLSKVRVSIEFDEQKKYVLW